MRITTLLKLLVGIVVLAVIALFVAVVVIDPNEYKDEIIAAVEERTGRDFSIDSDIDLKLGLTPAFAVNGVRMANADWASEADLLRVGAFAAEVALIPLVFGNLQINRLLLQDADIVIETDADGRSNLPLGNTGRKNKASSDAGRLPQINDVLIESSTITLVDGARGTTRKIEVKRLKAEAASLTAPLSLELAASATLEERAIEFTADGELGSPALLVSGDQPYSVDLKLTALGLTAKIAGTIADVAKAQGIDVAFDLSGSDLQQLRAIAGDGLPAAEPVALSGAVKGSADNARIENIVLQIGQSTVGGNASLDLRGARPRIEADVRSEMLDLTELLPANQSPDANSESNATAETASGKVFPQSPLPLELLKIVDAQIDFAIAALKMSGATVAEAQGELVLDNGALAINPLSANIADSKIAGKIGVDARKSPAVASLELNAPELDIGLALREFAGLDKLRGSGAMDISLRGAGDSVAEIMASLDGHTRLIMDQGEMKNDFLGNISGLSQTVGEAFGKKEWIVVECIASDFEIANGIANSRVNIVNTELLLITTEGSINLGTEKPDLKVTPRPKGIDLSLAVPVNVGGTLANPTFSPDALATAKKVGGILGAIAFPPAALIGLGELGSNENPCLQTAQAEDAPAQPQPSRSSTPVDAVTDRAEDAIEDVGKGLKKLFGN